MESHLPGAVSCQLPVSSAEQSNLAPGATAPWSLEPKSPSIFSPLLREQSAFTFGQLHMPPPASR